MELRIEIDMNNDAFEGARGREVARILRELLAEGTLVSGKLMDDVCEVPGELQLYDVNGNRCGRVVVAD